MSNDFSDEPQQDLGPTEDPTPIDFENDGVSWGLLLTAAGMALVAIFAVQNTGDVEVRFLWMNGRYPLAIVILASAVAAIVFSGAFGSIYRRRKRRLKAEQEELKQLRGKT